MSSPGLWLHGDDGLELICGDYIKNPLDCDLQLLVNELRTAGDIVISGKRIVEALRNEKTKETI